MTLWQKTKQKLLGWAIVWDEGFNVLFGADKNVPAAGNPHDTVSQRLAQMRQRGSKTACWACKMLTRLFCFFGSPTKDHCADALQNKNNG